MSSPTSTRPERELVLDADTIAAELARTRARTLALVDGLDEAEQRAQVSELMSPFVWDLAHIGNYEELWLLRELDGRPAIDASYDDLYNAFEHPRWERPSLPILGPDDARAYDARVRDDVLDLLARVADGRFVSPDARVDRLLAGGFVYGMVLQHEHQHDETMLATHQLRGEHATPPPGVRPTPAVEEADVVTSTRVVVDGGPFVFGTADAPWAYDNERGAHEVDLPSFAIASVPVTNRQYRAFIDDGGYGDDRLWTPAGAEHRRTAGLVAPEFWRAEGSGSWSVLRFGERIDVDDVLDEPVQHVCWYEADAFARWAGGRLPTEAEWEKAATWDPDLGVKRCYPWGDDAPMAAHANLGQRHAGPAPAGAFPMGVSPYGCHQLIGDVWEWTSSAFLPHPGFDAFPYPEYSEVFWGEEHRVLKGGSWAADPLAVRGTFRNWDYPIRRQIFAGFRCAWDVS